MSVPLSRLSVRYLRNFVRPTASPCRQKALPPTFHAAAKNFDSKLFSTSNVFRCSKEGETQPVTGDAAAAPVVENPVVVERIEHLKIMTIGINRPSKRNCVNEETAALLRSAFEEFEADDDINIAVLHGIGGNFCAGYDLEELASLEQDELANLMAQHMESGPMGPTRMELTKPTIAAIEGWCVGGGLELALLCDMRVMDSTAQLGVLNRRFGVPLLDGGAVRLPQLIGLSRAMDLIMTGRIVGADEALQIGLVNRLCKPGTALGQAVHLAKEISTHPQQCLRVDRDSAIFATFSAKNLSQALQYEGENALKVISHEAIMGAKKFASGLGRHGKFNVSPVTEKQEWQKELDTMIEDEKKKQ